MARRAMLVAGLVASFGAAVVLRGQTPPGGPPPGPPPGLIISGPPLTGTGRIAGRVIDATSKEPLTGVLVTLNGRGGPMARVVVDDEGHFVIRNVPEGAFGVNAAKPGYLGGAAYQTSATGAGRPIEIATGAAVDDVPLALWRLGAATGDVATASGDPLVGVEVRALRRSLLGGTWRLALAAVTTTDDRGRYRLAGLPPGEYVIALRPERDPETPLLVATLSANPAVATDVLVGLANTGRAGAELDARVPSYVPVFHPNAVDPARAIRLAIGAAEERGRINFRVKPAAGVRLSGMVTGLSGGAENVTVRLGFEGLPDLESPIDAAVVACDAEGRFEFSGIAPGRYRLTAILPPRVPTDPPWWAGAALTVAARDVSGLTLPLRRGGSIAGRAEFTGATPAPPPAALAAITIRLDPADRPAPAGAAVYRGRVTPDGRVSLDAGVPPGAYLLRVATPPRGWTIRSATIGGLQSDALDTAVDLATRDVTDLVLTFTDQPLASLTGTIRDAAGRETAAATVLVFPVDRRLWTDSSPFARRLRLARPIARGAYGVPGLPQGEYFVAATAEEVGAEWQDPVRLEAWSRRAMRIHIGATGVVTADLKVAR